MTSLVSQNNKEPFLRDFNFIFGNFDWMHTQFYIWRFLHDEKFVDQRKKGGYVLHVIIRSMQDQLLIQLSKIICPDDKSMDLKQFIKKYPEDLIIKDIDSFLKKNKNLINRLFKWRNKYLAHSDIEFANKTIDLEQLYPIQKGEIEDIVLELSKLVEKIASNNIYDPLLLKNFFTGERNRIEERVEDFYKMIKD